MARATSLIPQRRQRLFALLTVAAIAAVTVLVAEVLVRTFLRYNTPDTVRRNSLLYEPTVYARHALAPRQAIVPGEAWEARAADEPSGSVLVINEHGFRGPSIALDKATGVQRVLVLGGSAVFDLQAVDDHDWPRLVERHLRQANFPAVEVVNAGVPGHSSADSLGRLVSHLWMLEPDLVLLYNAWNDIKSFRQLAPERPLLRLVEPHDPEANPFHSYRGSVDRLLANSQLYVKLRTRYFLRRLELGLEGGVDYDDLVDAYSPLALRQYRLHLQLFVDASRNIGARPVLLTQAHLVTAAATDEDRDRIAYEYQGLSHDALARAFDECNEAVRRVAAAKGADLIDLAPELSGRSELFHDHIHTTPRGSEALARTVGDQLSRLLRSAAPDPQVETTEDTSS